MLLTSVNKIVGYDVKSELKILIELGLKKLPDVDHDIMIGAFLINSLPGEQTLTELASAELGLIGSPFEDLDDQELITRAGEIMLVIKEVHYKQLKELDKLPKIKLLASKLSGRSYQFWHLWKRSA